MAFEYFMNMERISIDIAKEHVEKMTDDNMEDDVKSITSEAFNLNCKYNGDTRLFPKRV